MCSEVAVVVLVDVVVVDDVAVTVQHVCVGWINGICGGGLHPVPTAVGLILCAYCPRAIEP